MLVLSHPMARAKLPGGRAHCPVYPPPSPFGCALVSLLILSAAIGPASVGSIRQTLLLRDWGHQDAIGLPNTGSTHRWANRERRTEANMGFDAGDSGDAENDDNGDSRCMMVARK